MTAVYLIIAIVFSAVIFLNRFNFIPYLNKLLIAAFAVLQWIFTVYEFNHINVPEFYDLFKPDAISILFTITLSIIMVPALYHSDIYLKTGRDIPRERGIYFAAMIMLIAAINASYLSNHIAVTWIFIELTTLCASALIFHPRNNRSLEGSWKYIFVCSISITFVFIGILLLGLALQEAGHTDLSYPALIANNLTLNTFWLKLAFVFIFTGFTAKMGLAPMYTVGIDAKDKAPSPAGALFSSVLMNAGFVGIFRFYTIIAPTAIHAWADHILVISGLLSVFIATVYMLSVKNIKRMLAYSSIEHMGIVALGMAAGGIGYYAIILHMIFHSFVKSGMFFQVGQVIRIYNSKSIYDTGNYFKYNITGAIVLLLGFICVTAMPPSGLFISEFLIFRSLFEAHYIFVLIAVLLLLTMIIWAFGKNIFKLIFTPAVDFNESAMLRINPAESISQFILLGLVIYLGFNPPVQFVDLINESVKNLPR
jgi:hydrogenase-4 component F